MFQWRTRQWGPALLRIQETRRLGMATECEDTAGTGHCGCHHGQRQSCDWCDGKSLQSWAGRGRNVPEHRRGSKQPGTGRRERRLTWVKNICVCFLFFVCFGLFLNWREFKHVKASGGGRSEGRAKYNRERGECRQCFSGVAKKERGSKAELRCSVFLTEEAAPLPLWAGYSVAKSARSRRQRGRNCKHCPEIEKLVSSL